MKAILITGAAGFIGSNFTRYYRATHPEIEIVAFDALTNSGVRNNVKDDDGTHFIRGDIRDQDMVRDAIRHFNVGTIVNFAAESHNSLAILEPAKFFDVNLMGTLSLLEASRSQKIERFHQVSTCEVYGDMSLDSVSKFKEEDPYLPRTPYNASKAAADHAVQAHYHTFGIPATISVSCNTYGPRQFVEKIIPKFTINALLKKKLPVYKSSFHKREWIHVIDHCIAIDRILSRGRMGEKYNVGSGVEATVQQVVEAVMRETGGDRSLIEIVPDRPSHDRRYLLDCSKIQSELEWRCSVSFDSGLSETIRWYMDNAGWWQPLLDRPAIDESKWAAPPAGDAG